jgi:hypothetical protein
MDADLQLFSTLDKVTLQRRLANEEFVLSKFQKHADLVNLILDRVKHGTIDDYCAEWSNSIRESIIRIEKLKLTLLMK